MCKDRLKGNFYSLKRVRQGSAFDKDKHREREINNEKKIDRE